MRIISRLAASIQLFLKPKLFDIWTQANTFDTIKTNGPIVVQNALCETSFIVLNNKQDENGINSGKKLPLCTRQIHRDGKPNTNAIQLVQTDTAEKVKRMKTTFKTETFNVK